MDLKVYTKEEVPQPQGSISVYTPNVIDIIPDIIDAESTDDIQNHIWSLENLKALADVRIEGNKLIVNSDKVRYENGKLYVTVTVKQLFNAKTVDGDEELEQACALATIWQRGLDPLAVEEGVRWSEVLLGEVNVVQLMNDVVSAVSSVTNIVTVIFDAVKGSDGNSYLVYKLQKVG